MIAWLVRWFRENRTSVALFGIALALYTPGIWWGLPDGVAGRSQPWGTDENGPIGAINEVYSVFLANNPGFNPKYPLFQYLVQLAFVAPYYAGLWLTGHISYPAPQFPYGLDNPPVELAVLTLLARLPSLLMGAAVIGIAFRTGVALRNRVTGLIAASLVLVQYTSFYYSRTSNVDMGALFWTALGLYVFTVCLKHGTTWKRWMTFGIFGALATGTKDASYTVFLSGGAVMIVLDVLRARRTGAGLASIIRAPLASTVVAAAVYLVASGLIFNLRRFQEHLQFITSGTQGLFYFRYPATSAGYIAFLGEFWQQLVDSMGPPMLAAAIAGAAWWMLRQRRDLLLLIPAAAIFAGVIVPVRFVLLRFVMVITYLGALAAADLFALGWSHREAVTRFVARAALVVTIGWAAVRGADLTFQMLFDGRHTVAPWLAQAARPGDRIGHVQPTAHLPALPDMLIRERWTLETAANLSAANGPEWFLSLPLEDYEKVHDLNLPEETYQGLMSGRLGYRTAAVFQTPSLFDRRPATFVNPPVRLFVREDVWRDRNLGALAPPSR